MSGPRIGDRVRVHRPEKPEHAEGVVVDPCGPSWPVWVEHECDCWQRDTTGRHVRGYEFDELAEGGESDPLVQSR